MVLQVAVDVVDIFHQGKIIIIVICYLIMNKINEHL